MNEKPVLLSLCQQCAGARNRIVNRKARLLLLRILLSLGWGRAWRKI